MKTAPEINQEIRRIRERAKSLSGFWISEFAGAIATLEWALGKRDAPPSEDIGSAASGQGEIAKRLLEAVAKEARAPSKPKGVPALSKVKGARVSPKGSKGKDPKHKA